MSDLEIKCPRCGAPNAIALKERIADRKCTSCRGFLNSSGTGAPPAAAGKRRKVWLRSAADAAWQDEEEPAARRQVRWPLWFKLALPGFAILLCVPLFILLAKKNQDDGRPAAVESSRAKPAAAASSDAEKVHYPQTRDQVWVDAAVAVAKLAIAARTVDELLPLLHHEGISAEQIRAFYTGSAEPMLPIGSEIMKVQVPDKDYGEPLVVVQYQDSVMRPSALLLVERNGRHLVDWPSLVAHGEMELGDFISRRPAAPVQMRLRARRADIYQAPYDDRTRWSCLLLTDAKEVFRIYAYLDRKHPNAWRVESELPPPSLIAEDNVPLPVNCRLAFTRDDAPRDMVEMTDLLSMSWFDSPGQKQAIDLPGDAGGVR